MAKHKRPPIRAVATSKPHSRCSTTVLAPESCKQRPKKGVQRAHSKHHQQHISNPAPSPPPTLATRFHALPPELRAQIFAHLLVQPAKWDLNHDSDCELIACPFSSTNPPFSHITPLCSDNGPCQSGSPGYSKDHRWALNWPSSGAWVSPWRSQWAPPRLNPYICSACWDHTWRDAPRPREGSLRCLCARRGDLGILLVCKRWHAEAGKVFYRGNTWCFEDGATLISFVAHLRPAWREAITRVSLMCWPRDGHDVFEFSLSHSKKTLTSALSLLRRHTSHPTGGLPNLAYLELSSTYLTSLPCIPHLLGMGLVDRKTQVRFVHRCPLPEVTGVLGTWHRWEVYPQLAGRLLLRGGFAEEVARGMKGQRRSWLAAGGKGLRTSRAALGGEVEELRELLSEVDEKGKWEWEGVDGGVVELG